MSLINGLADCTDVDQIKFTEILSGYHHLKGMNREKELVYIDYDQYNSSELKNYSGAKFLNKFKIYVGIMGNDGNMTYGYRRFKRIKLDPVQLTLGCMAHDAPKRQGDTMSCTISGSALSVVGAGKTGIEIGNAIRYISESVTHTYNLPETKKKLAKMTNPKLTVPYVDNEAKGKSQPASITLGIPVKTVAKNGTQRIRSLADPLSAEFAHITGKPYMHDGKPLAYGNAHLYITAGSIISGYLTASISTSNMGFSFKLDIEKAVLKVGRSAGPTIKELAADLDTSIFADDEPVTEEIADLSVTPQQDAQHAVTAPQQPAVNLVAENDDFS